MDTPQLVKFMQRVQSGKARPDPSEVREKLLLRNRSTAALMAYTGGRRPALSSAWQVINEPPFLVVTDMQSRLSPLLFSWSLILRL